ncbi:MAG: hypothetical protein K0S27_1124 [Gammaproteobacteria bacterium]|jgi:hypothetical protein|nr:hypothetical protein [Gammaproteobacteria bacterium]
MALLTFSQDAVNSDDCPATSQMQRLLSHAPSAKMNDRLIVLVDKRLSDIKENRKTGLFPPGCCPLAVISLT